MDNDFKTYLKSLIKRYINIGDHIDTEDAAERINLAHYLSLGGSADTRVTRKVRERIKVQRKQHRLKSHHGTCMRSLAARVTRAYYGDIVIACFI